MASKAEIERDIEWGVKMLTSVLILYMTWRTVKRMDDTTQIQMRFWRGIARGARVIETGANRIANNANTEYMRLTP